MGNQRYPLVVITALSAPNQLIPLVLIAALSSQSYFYPVSGLVCITNLAEAWTDEGGRLVYQVGSPAQETSTLHWTDEHGCLVYQVVLLHKKH